MIFGRVLRVRFGCLSLVCMVECARLGWPGFAVAQTAPPGATSPGSTAGEPTVEERRQARSHMQEGERLFTAGDLEGALRSYLAGHAIMHVPTTGYEVAKVQALLGRLVHAQRTATEVADHPVTAGEPPVFEQARIKARSMLEQLGARIPTLDMKVLPADAQVFIADAQVDPAELAAGVQVDPGVYRVSARAPGHEEASIELRVSEGERRPLLLQLRPIASSAEPEGPPPREPIAETEDEDDARLLRAYVGFGVGAVGFGLAGVTGAMSLGAASDAREFCDGDSCAPEAQADINRSKSLATVANVGFAVGLIGVGYGLYEYFINAPSEQSAAVRAERERGASPYLFVSTGDAGIGVRGAF